MPVMLDVWSHKNVEGNINVKNVGGLLIKQKRSLVFMNALENASFVKVTVTIPHLKTDQNLTDFANKLRERTYSGSDGPEFRPGPCNFPRLVSEEQNKNNKINISQTREVTFEPSFRSKRSYGEVASEAPRKKMLTNNKSGYDQKDEILYFPNSRPNKTTETKTRIYSNPNYFPSGSSKMDDSIVFNMPSNAQQQIQENGKKFFDCFIQIPDKNKIQLKD